MTKHTDLPLTYEVGDHSGRNWPVALLDFGHIQNEGGDYVRVTGAITTDGVHASDFDPGDPEADLRLWASSPLLLRALDKALAWWDCKERDGLTPDWVTSALWAIKRATGEVGE
jgi:hypothetical protein